jgi:hypothetical protein
MPKKRMSRQMRIFIELAATVVVLAILIIWAAWAYYTSEGAVRHRAVLKQRDDCFAEAKYRYQTYLEQNGERQADGSYTLSEKQLQFIENMRKEDYRRCSELFFIK